MAKRLAPVSGKAWWQWFEASALTVIVLLVSLWVHPEDPLFTQGGFPWPWLAPVLIALRYGVLPGLGSTAVIMLSWIVSQQHTTLFTTGFPTSYFFGGLVLVMVCGEYSDQWLIRLRRLNTSNRYLDDRLSRVTGLYHLLQLSHEKLEQELLSRPATLRDTLNEMRQLIIRRQGEEKFPAIQQFVELLAQHCQLEGAAFYRQDETGLHQIAAVGEPVTLNASDSMILFALEQKTLVHLQNSERDNRGAVSDYLVVAPLLNEGVVEGLLVVSQMPFFALNQDNLQLLAVMLAYYADNSTAHALRRELLAAYPDCPQEFVEEFQRLWFLQCHHGVTSSIVRLNIPDGEQQEDMLVLLRRMKRGLDLTWEARNGNSIGYVALMPLSGGAAVEGYLARIDSTLQQHFKRGLEEAAVTVHITSLEQDDAKKILAEASGHSS